MVLFFDVKNRLFAYNLSTKLIRNPKISKLPPLSKGALQVSREPQNIIDAGQTIHGIYRNGKVRFWMKPKPPSPSLLQGFENYICVKAGKLGKIHIILSCLKQEKCDK